MKLIYSEKELQACSTTSKHYGTSLQILARLGALEFPQTPERKSKLEQEIQQMISTIYLPKIGDVLQFEDRNSGTRYKCLVKEVRSDGWLIGDPVSFHDKHWMLLEVIRNNKPIYRW